MPYDNLQDLPPGVQQNLPEHAQEIYRKAYNNAWEQYRNPKSRPGNATQEEVARKVAWAAVKHEFEKNVTTGKWEQKAGFTH